MSICATWEKQSYKRYSACVGGLYIGVIRWEDPLTGRRHWRVGEVFGNHHHMIGDKNMFDTLEEAQDAAESVALRYISAVGTCCIKYRPWRALVE